MSKHASRSRPSSLATIALVALLGLAEACGGTSTAAPERPTDVAESARQTYFTAMEELVAGNYVRAIELFNRVARTPRYLRYSALARLRIADAMFMQDRYQEAIEAYRQFLAQYEGDPNVPYARFRIAASYYRRRPTDWFASPDASEFDQTLTMQAERELTRFIETFPTSPYADEARRMRRETRRLMFDHEVYIADFYADRDKWRAAAWRLDYAATTYPEFVDEAFVWRVAQAYQAAGDSSDAARVFATYLERYPDAPRSEAARQRLQALRAEYDLKLRDAPAPAPAPAPEPVEDEIDLEDE